MLVIDELKAKRNVIWDKVLEFYEEDFDGNIIDQEEVECRLGTTEYELRIEINDLGNQITNILFAYDRARKYLKEVLADEDETRFSGKTIAAIKETALAEKYRHAERYYSYDERLAIHDWFLGLGMNVDFTYYDIANRMRSWGYEVNEDDEDDYYSKQNLYWYILTDVVYME